MKEPYHAFIIRIWVEHRDGRAADPIWRGEIEDVDDKPTQGREKAYFDHLEMLSIYFAKYLWKIGIRINDSGP